MRRGITRREIRPMNHFERFRSAIRLLLCLAAFSVINGVSTAAASKPTGTVIVPADPVVYSDGRRAARYRANATDQGMVLKHGDGPNQCDIVGARDVWVFQYKGVFYMHYDGAGAKGWLSCLATSKDLVHWTKKGPILDFGKPGENDAESASYGVTYFDSKTWHMFYLGTPKATPAPDFIPQFPYLTMKARSKSPLGPWVKQKDVICLGTKPGTYYPDTASPGQVIKDGREYLMFFSASMPRTIGIARTRDLNGPWKIDPKPALPRAEQIENTSLYYEKANKTWFMFTNHVGLAGGLEYTDAIWVYWTKDLNKWDSNNKAVVLDSKTCTWSKKVIGPPSVLKVGNRLAVLYDGNADPNAPMDIYESQMHRDVGLAWLNLPLVPPSNTGAKTH